MKYEVLTGEESCMKHEIEDGIRGLNLSTRNWVKVDSSAKFELRYDYITEEIPELNGERLQIVTIMSNHDIRSIANKKGLDFPLE